MRVTRAVSRGCCQRRGAQRHWCACLHVRCSFCQYLMGRVLKVGDAMTSEEQQHVFGLSPVRPQPRAPTASKSGFRIIKCSHRPL